MINKNNINIFFSNLGRDLHLENTWDREDNLGMNLEYISSIVIGNS